VRSTLCTFCAEVDPARRSTLDAHLADLAARSASPPYAPFGSIPSLHFASAVVFEMPGFPALLVFEHNFDGDVEPFVASLLDAAAPEVYALFSCCADFAPSAVSDPADRIGLTRYLKSHYVRPAAYHVGNVGRSVKRIGLEADLHDTLSEKIDAIQQAGGMPATGPAAFDVVRDAMRAAGAYGWVDDPHERQTAFERAGPWWRIAGVLAALLTALALLAFILGRLIGSYVLGVVAALALLLVTATILLLVLRRLEERDSSIDPASIDLDHVRRLAALEDERPQNHLASLTLVKPSRFRRLTLRVVLWAANLLARISTHGTLSGIPTIHFAHWSLLDNGRRLLFLSNYDGSWGSYLDDFVDKASRGLTAIWTNTVDFPRTRFLVLDGARNGTAFKAFARMRQTPTAVWYCAPPYRDHVLSVRRVDANSTLREGLPELPAKDALNASFNCW